MSGDKDFLDRCMDSVEVDASVKEFQQVFCRRCHNNECTHSGMGKSIWLDRMGRQKKALEDPDLVDPNRPDVQPIAHQSFEDARNLEQDAWSMPVEDDSEKRVHTSEPPTRTQPADKVDESAAALAGEEESDDGSETESEPEEENKPEPEEESQKSDQPKNNTDVPDEGILLDPDGDKPSSDNKKPKRKEEDWSHPEHGSDDSGGLTVNIDDGTEVD